VCLKNVKQPNLLRQKLVTLKIQKNVDQKPLSGYATQFIEKQKVRFMYGISEKQFSNYIKEVVNHKGTIATDYLFELLEIDLITLYTESV